MEQLKKLSPYKQIRFAFPNELQLWYWEAQETHDKRLMDRITERHNEIMKYDY